MPLASLLTSYSTQELGQLLRIFRSYKQMLLQVGDRAELRDDTIDSPVSVRVEYPFDSDIVEVRTSSQQILKKYFADIALASPKFIPSSTLVGGLRIFVGEMMMDISFQRFQNSLTVGV